MLPSIVPEGVGWQPKSNQFISGKTYHLAGPIPEKSNGVMLLFILDSGGISAGFLACAMSMRGLSPQVGCQSVLGEFRPKTE